VQALLVDLADRRILFQHLPAEGDDVVDIGCGCRQRFERKQPFGDELRLLRAERHQPHGSDIVDMADDEHRRQVGGIGLAGRAFGGRQTFKDRSVRLPIARPCLGAGAQAAGKLRRVIVGVARPFGVVVPAHQAAAVDRHQPRQVLVDARAMQAFVEVLPENLPVAVHHLAQHMAAHQRFQRPVAEIAGGGIEGCLRRAGGVLLQIDENEAAPHR
jgi:hypothetical protein